MEGVEEATGLASADSAPGAVAPTTKLGAASGLCCPALSVGAILEEPVESVTVSGARFSGGAGALLFTGVLSAGFLTLSAELLATLGLAAALLAAGALMTETGLPAVVG